MVDPFAPLDLLELSPSKDKTTLYYENLWHAVFYEEEIEDIAYKIGEWVKKRASWWCILYDNSFIILLYEHEHPD